MRTLHRLTLFAIAICSTCTLTFDAFAQKKTALDDVVQIEFPKGGYTFTLAQAAKGIKLKYKIVVAKDMPGVIPLRNPPSYNEPPGPSGLYPREQIIGNKEYYGLDDFGLVPAPPKEVVKTIKKGTHAHAFEWDGRNWIGPSDFGNPKGKLFLAGTYDVIITLRGKLMTEKGTVPYQIKRSAKLVLK